MLSNGKDKVILMKLHYKMEGVDGVSGVRSGVSGVELEKLEVGLGVIYQRLVYMFLIEQNISGSFICF